MRLPRGVARFGAPEGEPRCNDDDFPAVTLSELAFGPMRLPAVPGTPATGGRTLYEAIDAGMSTIHSSDQYVLYEAPSGLLAAHPRRHELEHVIDVQALECDEATFDRRAFERQIDDALRALSAERIAVVQSPARPRDGRQRLRRR